MSFEFWMQQNISHINIRDRNGDQLADHLVFSAFLSFCLQQYWYHIVSFAYEFMFSFPINNRHYYILILV